MPKYAAIAALIIAGIYAGVERADARSISITPITKEPGQAQHTEPESTNSLRAWMNTEPGTDRGPRAGNPRGVVVATASGSVRNAVIVTKPGRYCSRFCIPFDPQQTQKERDGQHDFDFEIGTWKTHLKRLLKPLTGSTTWVEYEGTTVVRKIWNGRANLVELVADGSAGHFEGLSLRLYNPETHQWSLNFAAINSGAMSPATIGGFKNGRGEFYNQETLNGRAIFVRFVISDITPNSCRFEQAFSDDGGKTWEVNWIATDTRVKE